MASLGDLPDFGMPGRQPPQKDAFGFSGFDDDFGENDQEEEDQYRDEGNNMSKYSNAEKYLDELDQEEKDGFRLEVKGPQGKSKGGNQNNKKKVLFGNKFGNNKGGRDEYDDEIEEDIQTERDQEKDNKIIESSLGHQAGITVSQSLGIDPSVDDLALDEYDHIEVVET